MLLSRILAPFGLCPQPLMPVVSCAFHAGILKSTAHGVSWLRLLHSIGAATMSWTKNPRTISHSKDTALQRRFGLFFFLGLISFPVIATLWAATRNRLPEPIVLTAGWQLQDVAKVPEPGGVVASPHFKTKKWYPATVPGTVLTTLVNDHVYPEPLYGENNRPEVIPESLCRTAYWYRTEVKIPKAFAGKHIW